MNLSAVVHEARIKEYDLKSGETFLAGAAVVLDGTPEVTECAADPAAVLGFSLQTAGNDPFPTKCLVAIAEPGALFWLAGDNDPTSADINAEYGIVKDSDGIWTVDGTDAVNTVVYVEDVDTNKNLYLVSILATVRQITS